ncbi:MAG: phosphogluconate dehydrogenase C-terminal domain-containing protein, partial [Anaerolineales bacterium]
CHPPLIKHEEDPAAQADFFGGVARQNIVCALMQGSEADYALGEAISRAMFAPVMNAHRITVEQMAILEPALTETVVLTCLSVVREALDEAIAAGVPADAARDFLLGHMGVNVGMFFGFADIEISDGAKLAMARGREALFRPDWKQAFAWDNVLAQVNAIVKAGRG